MGLAPLSVSHLASAWSVGWALDPTDEACAWVQLATIRSGHP